MFEVALALVVMGSVRLAVQVSFLRSCILCRCIRHYVRVRRILKIIETIRLVRAANIIDEKPTLHANKGCGSGNEDDITSFT